MRILLVNDDGIKAPGLKAMYDVARGFGEPVVFAPDRERSAVSHGITIQNALEVREVEWHGTTAFAVSGTPADCVTVALRKMTARYDLVMSGINRGANIGINILYSGTVSAAMEAAACGFPALAISQTAHSRDTYSVAAQYLEYFLSNKRYSLIRPGEVFNINVPDRPVGERLVAMSLAVDVNGARVASAKENVESDQAAFQLGYVTISPLKIDRTDYDALARLQNSWPRG